MPENTNATMPTWAKFILGLLVIVIAGQSWWIYRLAETADIVETPASAESDGQTVSPPDPTPSLGSDPWDFPDPFDTREWDPFSEMQHLRQQMDQLFGEAFGRFDQSSRFGDLFDPAFPVSPPVDLRETESAYEVTVDLPGVEDAEIETRLEDEVLTIIATTKSEEQREEDTSESRLLFRERRTGRFQRSIRLPGPVDPAGMTSEYGNGVLRIRIPKAS